MSLCLCRMKIEDVSPELMGHSGEGSQISAVQHQEDLGHQTIAMEDFLLKGLRSHLLNLFLLLLLLLLLSLLQPLLLRTRLLLRSSLFLLRLLGSSTILLWLNHWGRRGCASRSSRY